VGELGTDETQTCGKAGARGKANGRQFLVVGGGGGGLGGGPAGSKKGDCYTIAPRNLEMVIFSKDSGGGGGGGGEPHGRVKGMCTPVKTSAG